jgi:hypothetical protein
MDKNGKFIFGLFDLFRLPRSCKEYHTRFGVSFNIFYMYKVKDHINIGDDCASALKQLVLGEVENDLQKKEDLSCYLTQYLNRNEKMYFIENSDDIETLFTYVMSKFTHPNNEEFHLDLKIDEIDISIESFKEKLVKNMLLERLSLSLSIDNNDDDIIDTYHYYKKIKRIDFIDYENNKFSSYRWLTIKNLSDQPTTFIRHLECGENKIYFDKMNVKAFENNYMGKNLIVDSIHLNQPSFIQKIQINFNEPLKPGSEITIFYRLDWPEELNAFSYDNLNHSITLSRYINGISILEFGIMEKFDIVGVRSTKIKSSYIEENIPEIPRFFNVKEEVELKPLHKKKLNGFFYKFENPDGLAYRFMYRHKSKNNSSIKDIF